MPKCVSYILWGSAGHAKVLGDIIALMGGRVVALFDNNPEIVSCLPEVPLYYGFDGFMKWSEAQESMEGFCAAIAIGGARGNDRKELAQRWQATGLCFPQIIHPSASVSKTARIGYGCHILAHAVVAADVSMGSMCIINNSANVDHECVLGSGVHIAPGAILCGCVNVEDGVMIGAGAVILPRLNIGRNALVGAGAVVTRDVPPGAVVVGNPARIIRRLE